MEDYIINECMCGAITVDYTNESGEKINISMTKDEFNTHFINFDISTRKFFQCNYCVNHWGINLCACGSGEKVGECENELDECKNHTPAQTIDQPKVYALWN